MEIIDNQLVISPRDLISEIECATRLHLDWAVVNKLLDKPKVSLGPELKLLIEIGELHEKKLIEQFQKNGTFISIEKPDFNHASLERAYQQTKDAVSKGYEVISQATLFDGDFLGFADFLILHKDDSGNPVKDKQGRYVYDPVDAKSARSAKQSAVLQVAAYAHQMVKLGFAKPRKVILLLGGDKKWEAEATDVIDLASEFIDRVKIKIGSFESVPEIPWDAPREACTRCRWQENCKEARKANNDLSLVQNIRSSTRLHLIDAGIKTLDQLAVATDAMRPTYPHEVSRETFEALRAQAAIQIKGSGNEKPIWEEKDRTAFGLLPESNDGDIWFDMEGDPFAINGDGLEYMFGFSYLKDGKLLFDTFDAKDRNEEKEAFKAFVEFVLLRRAENPEMHIYHYASYEPSAMLRLSLRHSIFEFEIDQLIREGVFVDLYAILRKVFRFSTESMSIKHIEAIYQDKRNKAKGVTNAVQSVIQFEEALTYLRLGNEERFNQIYSEIRSYNKDDCDSTFHLDRWMRDQADSLGVDIASLRPAARLKYVDEPEEREEPVAVQLMKDIPSDSDKRKPIQQGIALLANAIYFHRREERPAWRNIFERANAEFDDLSNFNDVVVASDSSCGDWDIQGRQKKYRRITKIKSEGLDIAQIFELDHRPQALYEIAPDGFKQMQGSTRGFKDVRIIAINGDEISFEEVESDGVWADLPIALIPPMPIPTHKIQGVLRDELGGQVLERMKKGISLFPKSAWTDVLLKLPPRQKTGGLTHTGDNIDDIVDSLVDSDNSYVAVQGPPGTGKTYVGSHVIAKLANLGWKIGVVAQSHAVIENILDSVYEINKFLPIAKKAQFDAIKPYHVTDLGDWMNLNHGNGFVVGGTIWSFSAPAVRSHSLDLIVIDEAGQFSLANSLVVLSTARCGLLLGDPQQLPQVSQAAHPEPVEVSVLGHILGEHATMPEDLGYFLDETYRMHPKLAEPVSILQYEGKLKSSEVCSHRKLKGVEPGLQLINLDHAGNTTSSQEEADFIVEKIKDLLGREWIDAKGTNQLPMRALEQKDILIVTAYNMQVRKIRSTLEKAGFDEIRVGTFDKFQGQEAPVVLVSMATSSSEDLPRGIDFLLSPNRLNVAISRAQWVCYLVRSTQLSIMEPNSPKGMVQLGKFITLCKSEA